MSQQQFDSEDIGMLVLGIFAAAVMVGIASVEAFGVALSDSFTIAGYTASFAWVITVATFIGTIVTNEHTDLFAADGHEKLLDSEMDDVYGYAVLGAAALLVGWVFIPQVSDFITSGDIWGIAYVGVVATSQVAIGWVY